MQLRHGRSYSRSCVNVACVPLPNAAYTRLRHVLKASIDPVSSFPPFPRFSTSATFNTMKFFLPTPPTPTEAPPHQEDSFTYHTTSMIQCICRRSFNNHSMVECIVCAMYSHTRCVGFKHSYEEDYICSGCIPTMQKSGPPATERRDVPSVGYAGDLARLPDVVTPCWNGLQRGKDSVRQISHQSVSEGSVEPDVTVDCKTRCEDQGPDTGEISNFSSASCISSRSCDSAVVIDEIDNHKKAGRKHERCKSPSDSDCSLLLSDTVSRTSSGRPMDDLDDLDNHVLDMEVSKLRSWLLLRSKSEPFSRHLQCRVTYRQNNASTPQDQSRSTSTFPSSSSSPSVSSTVPTTFSDGTLNSSKRRRDDPDDKDERPTKKGRVPRDKSGSPSAPRLACLYNKYDPMMYRSTAQTDRRFEICETHDFENMNRL
jgi:hypothetical protein